MGWQIQNADEKDCQPRTLYPEKLSFKNEKEIKKLFRIKLFPDKLKLREFVIRKPKNY